MIFLKDLDTIEHELMTAEELIFSRLGGEYLAFERRTLLKAWEFLSGEERPQQSEQFVRSKSKFKKAKLPPRCNGFMQYIMHYKLCMSFFSQFYKIDYFIFCM